MTARRSLDDVPDGLANPEWVASAAGAAPQLQEGSPGMTRVERASPQQLRCAGLAASLAAKLLDAHLRNRVQLMQSRPADLSGLPHADAVLLIRAMIAAAHADGHIDPEERRRLISMARTGFTDDALRQQLLAEIDAPPSLEQLVRYVETAAIAERFYAVSATIARREKATNRAFLAYLATRLEIDSDVVLRINREADDLAPRVSRLPG